MTGVEIDAPAKFNLRLRVLAQLTTGYHTLETVFCALSLADTLRVRRGTGDVRLVVAGDIDVGPEEDNLVVRAARRFFLEMGEVGDGALIELDKRIPAAAGLGGGSSDAAATLRALNTLHDHPLDPNRLLQLGAELGSDVPFFLGGSALALAWGRGERLLTLDPLPVRPVLVVNPGEAMPTGQAFQRIAELRGGGAEPPAMSIDWKALGSWEGVATLAENDFEPVAIERIPALAAARDAMRGAGADIALLAGSGASMVGVFRSAERARSAGETIASLGFATWLGSTLQWLPEPRPL